jgi:predicted nuclease with RNAse H fold
VNLLGVDVGYSETKQTTGIAWRVADEVTAIKVGSSWDERRDVLPNGITFSVAALDAPILPHHEGKLRRGCEQAFYGGAFWNRCRPGLSHHGRSLLLSEAGTAAADQFANVLDAKSCLAPGLTVHRNVPVVEAFPNTFLGVLLPESAFAGWSKETREKKSDWLYRNAVCTGLIADALKRLGWGESKTINRFEVEKDHDLRAALVCLLTAGFALSGFATVVGDAQCGWFWLPPLDMWQSWAKSAIQSRVRLLSGGQFPKLRVWSDSILVESAE